MPGATIRLIDPAKIVKAPDVPEINSETKTQPADLYKLNPDFVTADPRSLNGD